MNKQELIIETLAFMQDEEKKLLKKCSKTLGDIVDNGFTDETKAFVKLMNNLYAVYDELENEMILEDVKRMKESGFVKLEPLKNMDLSKLSEMMKKLPPVNMMLNIPKIDLSNIVRRRND